MGVILQNRNMNQPTQSYTHGMKKRILQTLSTSSTSFTAIHGLSRDLLMKADKNEHGKTHSS